MLLHDFQWNSTIEFDKFNESDIDYEVINRPWGFYKSTLLSDFVQSKIITIFPGERLSLQKHRLREEHWVIVKGQGTVLLGDSIIKIQPGQYVFVPKGCKHQIINDSKDNIVLTEVQLGSYFGEDDILRYNDKYGRALKGKNEL